MWRDAAAIRAKEWGLGFFGNNYYRCLGLFPVFFIPDRRFEN